MPIRFVRQSAGGASASNGSCAGIGVDSNDGRLSVNPSGTVHKINHDDTKIVTASFTATPEQSGTTFVMDSTTSIIITLPSTAAGLEYSFSVKQLTSSVGHSFSPAAVDKFFGNGLTGVDDKDLQCSAATDRVGDFVKIKGDGLDGWLITSAIGTFAIES